MKVKVTLFNPSGTYYMEEEWEVPTGAAVPSDMERSPDFRRIGGGAALVQSGDLWGYPFLFPGLPGAGTVVQRDVHARRARDLAAQVDIRVQQGQYHSGDPLLLQLAQVHATLAQAGE
jgi:hypothetical protein